MGRLQDLVRKSEQGLGTAEGHISNLQETQEILQKELELTRARLRETTDSLYNVQVTAGYTSSITLIHGNCFTHLKLPLLTHREKLSYLL